MSNTVLNVRCKNVDDFTRRVVEAFMYFVLNRNQRTRAVTTTSVSKLRWTNMVLDSAFV